MRAESAMLLEAAAEGESGGAYKMPLDTQTIPWTMQIRDR